jgi:Flp pilus assembly CpaF family ATPase
MAFPRLFCHDQFRPEVHRQYELRSSPIRLGSQAPQADIPLESNFLPPLTAELICTDGVWLLRARCTGLVTFGSRSLAAGEQEPLSNDAPFRLHHWICRLDVPEKQEPVGDGLADAVGSLLRDAHGALLQQRILPLKPKADALAEGDTYFKRLEEVVRDLIRLPLRGRPQEAALVDYAAGDCVRSELLASLASRRQAAGTSIWAHGEAWVRYQHANMAFETELESIVRHVEARLRADGPTDDPVELLDKNFPSIWRGVEVPENTRTYLAERHLIKQLKDIVYGFGPLEDLLRTPAVSEIMVVDSAHIYVERSGVVQDSGRKFISDEVTCSIIERIVDKVGRQINRSRPLVDARLADGSRVHAVIPPLAVSGPCLTIRKFPSHRLRLKDLQEKKAITEPVRKFLEAAVADHRNILIAGGTGTGKTTLLNALTDAIDARERIVTVEDTAELQVGQEHVVSLEARGANSEGGGAITIRELVRNALRMRPDRIIVGECRGPEALDMLQAMNTGHDGSMTTIHANTPRDVISRLEVLVQAGNDVNLPVSSIHQQIASAIDLVVQLTRFGSGRRCVTQVTEVTGIAEGGGIALRDIFVMSGGEDDAALVPTGRLPTFISRITNLPTDPADPRTGRKLDLASFYL